MQMYFNYHFSGHIILSNEPVLLKVIDGDVDLKPIFGEKFTIITLVRHKKARFDSKMHGSTQKSPVRHKNAWFDTKMPSPACTS